jgi:hypothetical protein
MDVGRVLKDGWSLFVKDIGPIIVAALVPWLVLFVVGLIGWLVVFLPIVVTSNDNNVSGVGAAIGALVFGVILIVAAAVTIPFYMAIIKMVLRRVREGRPAQMGDITACFDQFGTLLVAAIVVGILVAIGFLLFIIPGVYLLTIWVFVFPLIVDRRMGLGEAMRQSRAMVNGVGFWMVFLNLLVIGVIVALVSNIPVAGILAVAWELTAVTAMYLIAAGEGALLPSAFAGPSAVWQGGQTGAPYAAPYGPPPGAPYGPGGDPQPYGAGYGPPAGGYGPPPQAPPPWMANPAGPPPWASPAPPPQAPPAPEAASPAPPAPEAAPPAPPTAEAPPAQPEPQSPTAGAPEPPEPPTPPEPPA